MIQFNIKDIVSITKGRDGKEYASLGFPKGTIYEGYLVTIPYYAAITEDTNLWMAKVKLSPTFIYYLSKTEIILDENDRPKPKNVVVQLSAGELKDSYNKFTDHYIDGRRVSIDGGKQLDNFRNQLEHAFHSLEMNRKEVGGEQRTNEIFASFLSEIEGVLRPESSQKVNMRYVHNFYDGLKERDYVKCSNALLDINDQLDTRFLNEKVYHLHSITKSEENKKRLGKMLQDTKELNAKHKV